MAKRKSPSRIRYEQSHPTVSARLPVEDRDKLLTALKEMNASLADALKFIAGEFELNNDQVRRKGYEEGYAKAKKRYMITYPCPGCGELIAIIDPELKGLVGEFMKEHGWPHPDCCPPDALQHRNK